MRLEQLGQSSPLSLLGQSPEAATGAGKLGVVMGRAGVGKTACLVQIGLDELLKQRRVLHVSLQHGVEHVQSWYDALLRDAATHWTDPAHTETIRDAVHQRRVILSYGDHGFSCERLEQSVRELDSRVDFHPQTIVIGGRDWIDGADPDETRSTVKAVKDVARTLGAQVWLSVRTHRAETGAHPEDIPAPCAQWTDLIDVALFLEPHDQNVELRLLKPRNQADGPAPRLLLDPPTLRVATPGLREVFTQPPSGTYILLSGGAAGAEAAFGACAERWGLTERNFTFGDRTPHRTRGLVTLGDEQLSQGAVSQAYVKAHMHRTYTSQPDLIKVLQSIWHQVNTAGEVFAVGEVLPDKTVKGGTGWAVELGRGWNKPVYVFDQPTERWLHWQDNDWVAAEAPTITAQRFCGTGTRALTPSGERAIEKLFEHSFGNALQKR